MYKKNFESETEKYNKERTRLQALYGGILGGIILLLSTLIYHILLFTDSNFFGITMMKETPVHFFFIGLLFLSPVYFFIGISSAKKEKEKVEVKKIKEPFVIKIETDIDIKKSLLIYLTGVIFVIVGYFFVVFPGDILVNFFGYGIISLCIFDMFIYSLKLFTQ